MILNELNPCGVNMQTQKAPKNTGESARETRPKRARIANITNGLAIGIGSMVPFPHAPVMGAALTSIVRQIQS